MVDGANRGSTTISTFGTFPSSFRPAIRFSIVAFRAAVGLYVALYGAVNRL